MVIFTFSCFRPKIPFMGEFGLKIQNCLKWNLVPRPICRIWWWCSLFFISYWKCSFWVNSVQKIKIFSLNWNLVTRLIGSFSTRNTLFGYIPCLKLVRVTLETWNLARKYTFICSLKKYTFQYQGPFNFADVSIFLQKISVFWPK